MIFYRIAGTKFSYFVLQTAKTAKLKQPKELFRSSRLRMLPFASIPHKFTYWDKWLWSIQLMYLIFSL